MACQPILGNHASILARAYIKLSGLASRSDALPYPPIELNKKNRFEIPMALTVDFKSHHGVMWIKLFQLLTNNKLHCGYSTEDRKSTRLNSSH